MDSGIVHVIHVDVVGLVSHRLIHFLVEDIKLILLTQICQKVSSLPLEVIFMEAKLLMMDSYVFQLLVLDLLFMRADLLLKINLIIIKTFQLSLALLMG